MTQAPDERNPTSLFAGEGEMCALMRSHDWSQTPLGPVAQWPQSLCTTISILLNSRYPMFTFWGPQLVKLYNDAYRPILGSTKHPQALGKPGPEVWPEIWPAIGPLVNQVMLEGKATWSDNLPLFMHRSGYLEEVYFTFSYSPVRTENGEVGGMFCACTETTQQVIGERRLRTLRDLAARAGQAKTAAAACEIAVNTLANNPADLPFALLYSVDEASHTAYLSSATGIPPNTPTSPAQIDLRTDDQQPWPIAQVMQTATAAKVEDVIDRFGPLAAGPWPEPPHTALVLPVAAPGQVRPTGLLIVGISPRRALDDDYQGFLDLVASQVASAIADARAYETERQRAEALAELDRAKTTFFSNISHEFRTPLTLMLAPLADVLARLEAGERGEGGTRGGGREGGEGKEGDDILAQLRMVQRNGLRLLKLVNTLLDFSRIEAGRMQAVYEPTDLATLTAELASTFRSLIEQAGLTLRVDCPPLPEPIYVDRDLWEKIVLNLLSNAFKFTFEGEIGVSLRWQEDRGVVLEIRDTGTGIPAAELPHLFERFHRVKETQGRSFEGTGIGLSLVQELVKLHGGTITVTSELGRGSRFEIVIPTGYAHLPAEQIIHEGAYCPLDHLPSATPYLEEAWRWLPEARRNPQIPRSDVSPSPPPTPSSMPRPTILLADDNADMRSYVRRLLMPQYQVEAVEDGMAALAAIRQQVPDLVLTDVMMPQMDGFALLKALRADPATQNLPIILLSARAGEEARVEGLSATADDYLTKPFSAKELLACISANLKLAHLRKDAAQREHDLQFSAERARRNADALSARLTQVLETMSDAFISLDRDWRITYQNLAAEQINHKPRSEVIGRTQWEEWPASVGTDLEVQYRRALAEQVPIHMEHHYVDPPKHDIWLEIHAYPSPEGLSIFFRDITERKQTDALLQAHQAQLQQQLAEIETIYQSAPIGLNVLDRDLRFVRINQRLADINGVSIEDHLGRTVREILPELADTAERLLYPILETGEPLLNVEISGETPAQPGVQRIWLESFLPLKDGDHVIGINTVCEEITERKHMEAARQQAEAALQKANDELELRVAERTAELRTSEATQRAILEAIPDLLIRVNHDGLRLNFISGGEVQLLPTVRTDVQQSIYDTLPHLLADLRMHHIHQALTTGKRQVYEHAIDINGDRRYEETRVVKLNDEEVLLMIRDITSRKQAEQKLELQAVITRNMAEGICLVRADNGLIVYANPKFEQMFGYDPDELTGKHVSIVNYATAGMSPEDVNQSIRTVVLAHQEATYEVHNVKKDGTPFWCSATASVFDHPDYGPVLVTVQQNISDRKQAEDQIRASLQEKELLLKEIYHRVKNNLQVIYSLLNLQARTLTDTAAITVLKDSQSRIRAMALVHEKLYKSQDLSQIDFCDYVTSLAFSLLEFYRSDSQFPVLKLDLADCFLDIETAIPCGLILTELLSNSLKHAFPGNRPGEIQITATLTSPHQITLCIADNGIGLPPDLDLKTVSSLGLQLVRNLTQQIKGSITIRQPETGTTFELTFPVKK